MESRLENIDWKKGSNILGLILFVLGVLIIIGGTWWLRLVGIIVLILPMFLIVDYYETELKICKTRMT